MSSPTIIFRSVRLAIRCGVLARGVARQLRAAAPADCKAIGVTHVDKTQALCGQWLDRECVIYPHNIQVTHRKISAVLVQDYMLHSLGIDIIYYRLFFGYCETISQWV